MGPANTMSQDLPYSVAAAQKAAQKLDAAAIRERQSPEAVRGQFLAKDGRTEAEQLTDLLNQHRNKMADHMATHGCFRCARTFVRGFTSTGPNPESFCPRGMELLTKIALVTSAMMETPVLEP